MMNEATLRTTNEAGAQEAYLLGSSNEETTRLMHQGNAYRPLTRRVFTEAGITRGMRVLDLGSGAGDVAFLTSDLVGDEGSVVGIDRDPKVLAVARKRAQAQHFTNVSFVEGDIGGPVSLTGPFDALVGRYILMYQRDPAAVIRSFLPVLRPNAVIAFHEADFAYVIAAPMGALLSEAFGWWQETLRRAGIEGRMGPKLFATMVAAGLSAPTMLAETLIEEAGTSIAPMILAEVIRATLPLMVRFGIADEADVGIETLEARIRAEAVAAGGCLSVPVMIGAWSRRP